MDLLYRGESLITLRNQTSTPNSLPGSPSGLHSFVNGNQLTLVWNAPNDEYQRAPLTYNVRIGTRRNGNDVVPSMSTTNGVRMVPARGNAGFNTWMIVSLPFDQLSAETLYWSVQSVDSSFAGGPFASEVSFVAGAPLLSSNRVGPGLYEIELHAAGGTEW